jgi:hypothetical protein
VLTERKKMTTITPHDEAACLAQLKKELEAIVTIRALQKRAEELGVDEDKLDDAEEKSDIVAMILETKWNDMTWQVFRYGVANVLPRGVPINGVNPNVSMVSTKKLGGGGTSGETFRDMFRQLSPLRDCGTAVYIHVTRLMSTDVWSMIMTVNHQRIELTPGIHTENWVTMMMDQMRAVQDTARFMAAAEAKATAKAKKKAAAYHRRMALRKMA